ncbi:AAEL001445-PA [Aedes aegypti]|uniref:AAEL001445-PA n=1 Tax=Aedes aegypti TaxID=7159 RepID=Q17L56_AEDAE|nr:AAEL001445-PA [Aedes aegypti]
MRRETIEAPETSGFRLLVETSRGENGFVECEPESCPAVDDCYLYNKKAPGRCCDKCVGCLYEGRMIDSGTEWTDPDDPCEHFKCVSGVITRSRIKCYTPCSNPLPLKHGQCCPICLGE